MPKKKAEKLLFVRFGGIGDSLSLTSVMAEAKRRRKGCKIHFAVRAEIAELFRHNKLIDRVLPLKRMPPSGLDCVQQDFGWVSVECIKKNYTMVYDFKYSVELNSPWQQLSQRDGPWRLSMNSNFTHWVELSLAWANIDWTQVTDFMPKYVVTEEEREWAKDRLPDKDGPLIGIQLRASSLARTWYRSEELPQAIHALIPDARIAMFDHDRLTWVVTDKVGRKEIPVKGEDGLRKSAALVSRMDLLISADSGFSHVAAAVETPTLTVYTTVPGWTREKYYPLSHAIQSVLPCSPCFTLDGTCPKQQRRSHETLSEREKRIMAYHIQRVPPQVAAAQEKMPVDAFMAAFQGIQQKQRAMCAVEPDCMRAVSPELIAERAEEVLNAET